MSNTREVTLTIPSEGDPVVTSISVLVNRKVVTKNFESLSLSMQMEIQVPPGCDWRELINTKANDLDSMVILKVGALKGRQV